MNASPFRQWLSTSFALLTASLAGMLSAQNGFAANDVARTDPPGVVLTSEVVLPRSVFVYRAGKDPFFPNRPREDDKAPPQPQAASPEALVLRGITGSVEKKVALINDRTFTKGEAAEIKLGTNTLKIRVVEIKDRSVTIERDGQPGTSDLPLTDNFLPLTPEK